MSSAKLKSDELRDAFLGAGLFMAFAGLIVFALVKSDIIVAGQQTEAMGILLAVAGGVFVVVSLSIALALALYGWMRRKAFISERGE